MKCKIWVIFISYKQVKYPLKITSKYIVIVLAAAFALGFVVVTPYVMAEMGEKKHGDMTEMINAYCSMSAEEQAEVIAKHNKSDEMVSKMNEYCSLDEEGRAAKMAEMKSKHSGMTGEYDASKHAGMTGMTGEYDASKHTKFVEKIYELKQAHADGDFDKVKELTVDLEDLRNQIIDLIKI